MHGIGLFGVVLVGLAAGWVAQRAVGRRLTLFQSLVLGVAGAILGGATAEGLGIRLAGATGGLVAATGGAVLLLSLWAIARRGR